MPRKTLKQQRNKRPTDTDTNVNRVREIVDGMVGNENPDDLMIELLEVLTEGPKVPEPGNFYLFVYNAKTPNIQYDQNPFVAVTDVFEWGFRGLNLHWGETRQYTWSEVAGGLYKVFYSEVEDIQSLPIKRIRLNN